MNSDLTLQCDGALFLFLTVPDLGPNMEVVRIRTEKIRLHVISGWRDTMWQKKCIFFLSIQKTPMKITTSTRPEQEDEDPTLGEGIRKAPGDWAYPLSSIRTRHVVWSMAESVAARSSLQSVSVFIRTFWTLNRWNVLHASNRRRPRRRHCADLGNFWYPHRRAGGDSWRE